MQKFRGVRLRDVCSLRTEPVDPTAEPELCHVGLEHIDSGSPRLTRFGTAAEVTSSKWRFHPGDVLYGKLRPYLDKAVLADREGICSTDILVLKPSDNFDAEYLVSLAHTNAFVDHAVRTTAGVNHPRTNWSSLGEFSIPLLPSPSEQRAIARMLRSVQDATGARRRELALERERKAALLEHLLAYGTRGEPTIQTVIGQVPESWQIRRLADVAVVAYGLTVNQQRRSSSERAPYLTVANVTRGALRLDDVPEIGLLDGDAERYRLQPGDILLVEGSGNPRLLGSAAIWGGELPLALHQNHLIRARPRADAVVPRWLMEYINSDSGRAQLLGKSKTSSGLHNINSQVVAKLNVPLPALDEQREIADILAACDAKTNALEREIALYDELLRGLLEELMSGRLSVAPMLEEAAA